MQCEKRIVSVAHHLSGLRWSQLKVANDTDRVATGDPEKLLFDQTVDNAFLNRIDCKTPIKGLYLASAWGNPGGGYGGLMRFMKFLL